MRILRIGIKALCAVVAIVALAVGAALLLLQTERGRQIACGWLLGVVNDSIPGRIEVDRCVALSPARLSLDGASVRDPGSRVVLTVDRIEAEPRLSALLTGTIELERARADRPLLRLVDHGDELAIVSAFVPSTDTDDEDESDVGIALVFGLIEVTDGRLADLPDGRSIEDIQVKTSLTWIEDVVLEVQDVGGELVQDGEPVVQLRDGTGSLRFGDRAEIDARALVRGRGLTGKLDARFEGSSEAFSIDATATTLGGRIDARATNASGEVEAHLEATNLHLGDAIAQARGTVGGQLEATLGFSDPALDLDSLEQIEADASFEVTSLSLQEVRADSCEVRARIEGTFPAPHLHVSIDANQIESRGETVERLALVIEGEGGRYRARGRAPLPNGWLVGIDVDSGVDWPRVVLDGEVSLARAPLSPLTAELSGLVFRASESISADSVTLIGQGIDLVARGRYALDGATDVSFRLRTLDLDRLSRALDLPQRMEGDLHGSGHVRGTPTRPELRAGFRLDSGSVEGVSIESLETRILYDTNAGAAETQLSAVLEKQGELSFRARAALSAAKDPTVALARARYDAQLMLEALPVGSFGRLIDGFPSAEGTISAEMTARGEVEELDFQVAAHGHEISTGSFSATDVYLEATLDDGKGNARLEAASREGTTAVVTAAAHVILPELAGEGATAVLSRPWELTLHVPEQPLVALPIEIRTPTSARGSIDARASGDSASIRADVEVDVRFPTDEATSDEPRRACERQMPARVRMHAQLRDRSTEIEWLGYLAHEKVLRAYARAPTPIYEWIERGLPPRWPTVQARLDLEPVALGAVPILCRQATGELRAQLEATGLFDPAQQIKLRLESHGLAMGDASPVDAVVRAEANAARATAKVDLASNQRELLQLDARAPIALRQGAAPLGLGAGPVEVSADFDDAPLSLLLAPVPTVSRPEGRLDGHLTLTGEAQDPSTWALRGVIQLADASMTLRDPFLRLDQVDADLELETDRWVIRSLSAHDRDGRIAADGTIAISEWKPEEVALTLEANRYPLRREGIPMADLSGQIEVVGDLTADPRVLRMKLGKDVSLALPDELRYGVQSLTPHPFVIYEGEPGFDRSLSVEEALRKHTQGAPLEQDAKPLIVHVTSSEPFWVRRHDFAFQLGTDLEVHSEEDALRLQGEVELRRGFLVMLNKNFDLKSGTIQFTGATPIDPTVDLSATHRLRSGYVVTIDVEGRVSEPELTFSSDAPGANTNAEIVALLLGVSRHGPGDEQAEDQTRSVLAGLTAGLVGSLARRELGQYAPIIAVESEGTAETTRVRAGVTVGDLIPDEWQDVLLGVYVEGMLAGSEEGPRGGFLLELLFPHHLSTTTTYEQPDNWSLDLLWQP